MFQSPSNLSLRNQRVAARRQHAQKRLGYDKPLTEKEIRAYMRPRGRRLWIPATVLLIFLSYLLQAPLLVLCALLVLALGIVPEIWFHISLHGVRFHRSFSESKARIGEEVTLSYRLENHKLVPVPWLEIEDELPDELEMQRVSTFPSYKEGRRIFLTTMALWLSQRVTRRYRLRPRARGVWKLGPAYLRAGDPFGFLQNEVQIEQLDGQNSLLVYPIVAPLASFGLPSRHPFGDRRATRQVIEDPSQIVGIRDYAPGDALRRVHWKATAKVGTLQSKIYPPTTTYSLVIFLDINTTLNPTAGIAPDLLELGIAAAASVANWATEQHYAVGIFSNGLPGGGDGRELSSIEDARAMMRVPPSTHPNQLPRILELLARLQPFFGAWMERVLTREATRLAVGATVVYITAAAALTTPIIAQLAQLKRHGHQVAVLLTGDAAIATGSLTTYRLGGEEEWHALSQYRSTGTGANAGYRSERDGQLTPGDGGESTHHSADHRRRERAFTLG